MWTLGCKKIISDYAPKIYYHPQERNYGGSLRFFLRYMAVYDSNKAVVPGQPTVLTTENLNFSPDSKSYYLDFAPGRKPNRVFLLGARPGVSKKFPRSYAILSRKANDIIDVHYIQFYPYQQGQLICGATKSGDTCSGAYIRFNSRNGDWSRVTLRLKGGKPHAYFVKAHLVGDKVLLSNRANATFSDNHINVYSALGTHDMYLRPGNVVYKTLSNGEQLVDQTATGGLAWETWKNLKIHEFQPDGKYSGGTSWMGFEGRWAPPKSDCLPEHDKIVPGHCGVDNGVTSPALRAYETSPKLRTP